MEQFTPQFFLVIIHLIGVAIGLGGALFGDFLFFSAAKNGVLSLPELRLLRKTGLFVTVGLLILVFSGVALFFTDPAKYLDSTKFLAKLVVVAVIAANGVIFHTAHFKTLKHLIGIRLRDSRLFARKSVGIFISGAVSVTSWLSALVLGSLRGLPFSIYQILYVYAVLVLLASLGALFLRERFLGTHRRA